MPQQATFALQVVARRSMSAVGRRHRGRGCSACHRLRRHDDALRALFYSVGFRELSRDAPLIKTKPARTHGPEDLARA
jgi:hypothetical protein